MTGNGGSELGFVAPYATRVRCTARCIGSCCCGYSSYCAVVARAQHPPVVLGSSLVEWEHSGGDGGSAVALQRAAPKDDDGDNIFGGLGWGWATMDAANPTWLSLT